MKKEDIVEKEINRIVEKYLWNDSKELFRAELRYLVLIAEREQMKADRKATMRILKEK